MNEGDYLPDRILCAKSHSGKNARLMDNGQLTMDNGSVATRRPLEGKAFGYVRCAFVAEFIAQMLVPLQQTHF